MARDSEIGISSGELPAYRRCCWNKEGFRGYDVSSNRRACNRLRADLVVRQRILFPWLAG